MITDKKISVDMNDIVKLFIIIPSFILIWLYYTAGYI